MDIDTLYFKLPVALQNLFVSFYGYRLQKRRYGKHYYSFKNQIEKHLDLTAAQLESYQIQKLKETITIAANKIPYYKDLFNQHSVKPEDFQSIEELKKIPILDKEILRQYPERFINSSYPVKSLFTVNTSGTTGKPVKIYCNSNIRQKNYAFFDRFLNQVGIDHKGKRATFGGRLVVSPNKKRPPFWRYSIFQKNLLMSTYHLTDRNIPLYIEKLRKFKPDYIDTYPTSLFLIAKYAHENDISLKGITKAITSSAETLLPQQRKIIEEVFDVNIYDQYGSSEMCVFIAQCKAGRYHIHPDYGIVEFINKDGEPAQPGEEAEMVCTGFINDIMPLIRYKIGDIGLYTLDTCICGSSFPLLAELAGRMDDYIVTPDGKKVSRIGRVFYNFPVKEVQYIQREKSTLEVHIIKDENYTEKHEKEAKTELRKRLGTEIALIFNYVDNIERSSNGKLKTVISYVK